MVTVKTLSVVMVGMALPVGRPRTGRGTASHRGSQRGLALIEVVIAVGLLVTLAAGVVYLFVQSARSMVQTRHRTSALMLAVAKLEQVRSDLISWPATSAPPSTPRSTERLDRDGRPAGTGLGPGSDPLYTRAWSVTRLSARPRVWLVRVTVAPIRGGGGVPVEDPAAAPDSVGLVTLVPTRDAVTGGAVSTP
jgi:type II secretory pathway pseudopilin PulG